MYCNIFKRVEKKYLLTKKQKDSLLNEINDHLKKDEYFAPLSSPKPKHKTLKNKLNLLKINNGTYGVINFNNMIPVKTNDYIEFDLNKKTDDKTEMFRINLLNNQLRWLTSNKREIMTKSKLLYNLYKNDKLPKSIKDRCCNFLLLEEKCKEYNKKSYDI